MGMNDAGNVDRRSSEVGDLSQDRRKPKVLVVDDERNIADVLATIFGQNGYDATAWEIFTNPITDFS